MKTAFVKSTTFRCKAMRRTLTESVEYGKETARVFSAQDIELENAMPLDS
jgi:hypothetical protein